MGLTNSSVWAHASNEISFITEHGPDETVIALAGNPNVGKSTIFNALTGLNQHTGNWPGKTVTNAEGVCRFGGQQYRLIDIPGTYSLMAHSAEEEVARMRLEEVAVNVDFTVGDTVQVVSGPLESFAGVVTSLTEATQKVMVNVEMFGRKTDVELDFVQVKKVNVETQSTEQE